MELEEGKEVAQEETPNPSGEESPDNQGAEVPESPPAQKEGESGDVVEGEQPSGDDEPPKRNRVQERIDELTRKYREAENRAAYLQGRIEGKDQSGEPESKVKTAEAPNEPKESDFEDYTEFVIARARWEADARYRELEEERQKRENAVKFADWRKKGSDKFKDFAEVVMRPPQEGGPAITNEMAAIINDSPMGHDLAYFLGLNVEESYRIANMSPLMAARELGKLEAKLTKPSPTIKAKTISDAPAPIKPIETGTADVETPIEKMSIEEFIAKRNREEFGPNWRGGTR